MATIKVQREVTSDLDKQYLLFTVVLGIVTDAVGCWVVCCTHHSSDEVSQRNSIGLKKGSGTRVCTFQKVSDRGKECCCWTWSHGLIKFNTSHCPDCGHTWKSATHVQFSLECNENHILRVIDSYLIKFTIKKVIFGIFSVTGDNLTRSMYRI